MGMEMNAYTNILEAALKHYYMRLHACIMVRNAATQQEVHETVAFFRIGEYYLPLECDALISARILPFPNEYGQIIGDIAFF
jgi:hypothetical protein